MKSTQILQNKIDILKNEYESANFNYKKLIHTSSRINGLSWFDWWLESLIIRNQVKQCYRDLNKLYSKGLEICDFTES